MAAAKNDYRLVIFTEPADPHAVRDLLCRVTGIHPTDAMQWVARTPGIWPRPLAEDQTRALLDGLYELGVPAEAWRADLLPNLSPPRTIHDAACLPGGLRITGLRGEPIHWVPWEKVDLVSAGRIVAEDEYRDVAPPGWASAVATGLNALLHRRPPPPRRSRAQRIPRDALGEVLVVRRDPRIAFRIVEDKMNYAALGDRLRPSARENFPLLLADLCAGATGAYLTPPTRALLEGGDPGDSEFPSSQALLEYSTHRLLWSWYRRDRDADQSTQS
ncbi:MAG TPA: hypothetical protein VF590_00275 [Isosphaeraceae bacterium]|jgi:hypothetical protein